MKLFKKIILLVVVAIGITGCAFKSDDFDGITIYTTTYTVEYITKSLYGEYSTISSIYPDGVNIGDYQITPKKIQDFSKGDLFIYNGLNQEKQIATELINKRKKMHIIAVSEGLEGNSGAELWLNPSNALMVAQNIKNGLKNNIKNPSIINDIDKNYEDLKILISEYDAELKLVAENATNNTIITANKDFNFLAKYGYEIINVAAEGEASSSAISRAKKAFSQKENTYLFILKGTEDNQTISELEANGAKLLYVNPMTNLNDEERRTNVDYISLMNLFIDAIKAEVY